MSSPAWWLMGGVLLLQRVHSGADTILSKDLAIENLQESRAVSEALLPLPMVGSPQRRISRPLGDENVHPPGFLILDFRLPQPAGMPTAGGAVRGRARVEMEEDACPAVEGLLY